MIRLLRQYGYDERGNFAILTALLGIPIILSVGAAVDLSRQYSAQMHLQDIADTASLAMAISKEQLVSKVREVGEASINVNLARRTLGIVNIDDLKIGGDEVELALSGYVNATFMSIAGYDKLPVNASALAKRKTTGTVEVALVLDNTYSMIGPGTSSQKINSLKKAATGLIDTLMNQNEGDAIKIGLVPYADSVNVGTKYQGAYWLAIEPRKPDGVSCRWEQSETRHCVKWGPSTTYIDYIDGIPVTKTKGGDCLEYRTDVNPDPKEVCTPTTDKKIWHGCVLSREKLNRRTIANPSIPYIAPIENANNMRCPTPIIPLTSKRSELLDGVKNMITHRGTGYQPNTYIPSGLVWGWNVLSPSDPLPKAAPYSEQGDNPRKIMVLMTDGDNTMIAHDSGYHGNQRGDSKPDSALSSGELNARKENQKRTDLDSSELCRGMKSKNIEIYTVAFMVETERGRELMQYCATSDKHYFEATDQKKLEDAFAGIADSINRIRLAR